MYVFTLCNVDILHHVLFRTLCSIRFLDMVSGTTTFFALSVSIRVVEGLGTSAFIIASFAIIAHTFPDKAAAMIVSFSNIVRS